MTQTALMRNAPTANAPSRFDQQRRDSAARHADAATITAPVAISPTPA